MKIYNSLSKSKEEFIPMNKDNVKMYACGITVYDDCHVGHARQAITYDMICSYLRYRGYNVTYVRNYTDVDDKIIAKANAEGIDPLAYSERKIEEAEEDFKRLKVGDADIKPKASENIENIIKFVETLIEKGHAYATEKGDVYFSVKSFPTYGKLSKRNIDELISGVRKDVEEGKNDPIDFALWKSAKEGEVYWKSPWGNGRPGWHIECSAMIMDNLGEEIDIHGGGKDLIFPHHENEIAQSEALTGHSFVKYWTHNGLIKVDGQKMSKSLGNSLTIKQVLDKYNPEVIKYVMLSKHYSTDVDLNDREFSIAENHLYYFYNSLNNINKFLENNKIDEKPVAEEKALNVTQSFINAMDDDFNTSAAISELFAIFKHVNNLLTDNKLDKTEVANVANKIKEDVIETYKILGILQENPVKFIEELKNKYLAKLDLLPQEIDKLVNERSQAKANKDYALADKLREELDDKGIILNDSKEGTTWDIKDLYNVIS